MKRFSQLTQTATEVDLAAGNFLAVDIPGVGGVTKKVPGNLVAPRSVQEYKKANVSEFLLVNNGLDETITLATSVGVVWRGVVDVIVLPGKKVTMRVTADASVRQASGVAYAYFEDGTHLRIWSSWPNYNFSYTNVTGKTISKIKYVMDGMNIIGDGEMSFNVKVDALTADIDARLSDFENDIKAGDLLYTKKGELSIVAENFDNTITHETTTGETWQYGMDVVVLPGHKVIARATADASVNQQASGYFIATYTDGTTAILGGSWPNYGWSTTNTSTKTIAKMAYKMDGMNIIGDGEMSFNVKVDALTADLATKIQIKEITDGLVEGSVLLLPGTETSGWSFNPNEFLRADGTAVPYNGYVSSDYIPAFGDAEYTLVAGGQMFNVNQPVVFYNSSRAVIGYYDTSTSDTSRTFTTPVGTSFIRYSCYGSGSGAKLTYIGEDVKSIAADVDALKNDSALLPCAKVYGVVGVPIYVWLDALFKIAPKNAVCHKVSGSGTLEKRNCICYDLEGAYSSTTLLKWYSATGEIKIEQRIPFKVVAANAKSGTIAKVMLIGDSIAGYGKITYYLDQMFQNDAMDITLLGTMGSGSNKYEGRGGWSSYDYTHTDSYNGSTNAFLNDGVFDFGYYLTQNNIDIPDIVIIELGTNDYWRPSNGTSTHENIEEMITSIKAANADVKIIVLTADCPYLGEDASLAENYYPRFQLWDVSKDIVDNFANREDENIFCAPMGGIFHPIASFPITTVPVCPHSSETTTRCTDRIHPTDVGFQQIADELFCAIKAI